MILFKK